ncbi:Bacteriophage abortive infection AbiH [Chryseobacterium taichungense]|uniref:Bacteriophage abortive infection AbiH n=1 Tax=Chryseobacterium taichungense TaxID=295069 RepID=A0A1H8ABM4_9FLAO|nr:AbiH family protein [Chryseobacterium taichungense]SEM67953.1 Bacteriophage abortive infection AbiH [Chryseobacterium taichungense]
MINRIVLIGNGFDIANGLPTTYKNFIDDYWARFCTNYIKFTEQEMFECDEFVTTSVKNFYSVPEIENYRDFFQHKENSRLSFTSKNDFFLNMCHSFHNKDWWDVERYFYEHLKEIAQSKNRIPLIKKLNTDFDRVKKLLQEYLITAKANTPINYNIFNEIKIRIFEDLDFNDVSEYGITKIVDDLWETIGSFVEDPNDRYGQDGSLDHLNKFEFKIVKNLWNGSFNKNFLQSYLRRETSQFKGLVDTKVTFLNFNYTDTEKQYVTDDDEVIKIHGELNSENNPIIFGYGDELDDFYSVIEKLNDNDFLENVKSINYSKTENYKKLLQTIDSGMYQIYVMGHSCGNSDRTLLNTLFEHDNCISIKIFYHQKEQGKDNYLDIYKNISRNFNNKAKLRDRVVNKNYSHPLVPIKLQNKSKS